MIAVEPQARLLPVITENLRLNQLSNATIVSTAISETKGKADFSLAHETNSGSSGIFHQNQRRLPHVTVETQSLSDLLAKHGVDQAAFVKVDVEGFEHEVVMGSQAVFRDRRIQALALEFHPGVLAARGLSMTPIGDFLFSCGYELDRRFVNTVFVRK